MYKRVLGILIVVTLLTPGIVFRFFDRSSDVVTKVEPTDTQTSNCVVRVLTDEGIQNFELETYVASVMLGEVPASFSKEAIKAQAVAARTYTLKQMCVSGKHDAFDLCTEPSCCQAFTPLRTDLASEEMIAAATETAGEVLLYDGNLIDATYFSCSGGYTEAAVEVWGADIPYLQSRESPGEENSKRYQSEKIFTKEEFYGKLGLQDGAEIGEITYTDGGGVKLISIGSKVFTGVEMRKILSLPSTAFEVHQEKDAIIVTSKGYGHRVGMSQYGAEAMAVSGSTYDEILSYYYPGTQRAKLTIYEIHTMFDKAGNL